MEARPAASRRWWQPCAAVTPSGDAFQFVFLDYQMPEMDGILLALEIHNDPSLRGTPMVMLTSIEPSAEARRIQGEILDACLTKPVRQSHLFDTVVNVWAKHQGVTGSAVMPARAAGASGNAAMGRILTSGRMRVMVAEDNIINQNVACRMLERLGLRADVAANGREAVEMSRLAPYDLVLMDCQMPELDGYEATREIRRREGSNRRTVILAMTADAMIGAREKCMEAGMDGYIAKPVRFPTWRRLCGTGCPKAGRRGKFVEVGEKSVHREAADSHAEPLAGRHCASGAAALCKVTGNTFTACYQRALSRAALRLWRSGPVQSDG